jgi:hypothetical protein
VVWRYWLLTVGYVTALALLLPLPVLLGFLAFCGAFFWVVVPSFQCRDCPYKGDGWFLKCGIHPYALQFRKPGPLSKFDKIVSKGAMAVWLGVPLVYSMVLGQWTTAMILVVCSLGWFVGLGSFVCSRCENKSCWMKEEQGRCQD